MKAENLEKASEIKTILKVTTEALHKIDDLINIPPSNDDRELKDGTYNLTICKYYDGSGGQVDLSRYWGNGKLLKVIKQELLNQIDELHSIIEVL